MFVGYWMLCESMIFLEQDCREKKNSQKRERKGPGSKPCGSPKCRVKLQREWAKDTEKRGPRTRRVREVKKHFKRQ